MGPLTWYRPLSVCLALAAVLANSFASNHYCAKRHQKGPKKSSPMLRHGRNDRGIARPLRVQHYGALSISGTSVNDGDEFGSNLSCRGGDEVREGGGNRIAQAYSAYMRQLEKRPLRTQSVTAGVISLLGDLLSQNVEARVAGLPLALNLIRLSAFTIAGAVFVGPFVHQWYEMLWKIGRWQERRYGVRKLWQILTQNLVDQTVGVALFFPTYFYVYEYAEAAVGLRAPSFAAATAKMQSEIVSVMITEYRIWPLTNFIIFTFVPESLRVLISNVVSVFWNAYLCTKVA